MDKQAFFEKIEKFEFCGCKVPPHTVTQIAAWVFEGDLPGGFLRHVLRNNLTKAALEADSENFRNLAIIVKVLWDYCPASCWGSAEALDEWKGTKFVHGSD